jgi:hypothetical protein
MTTVADDQVVTIPKLERQISQDSFEHFLDYVQILEPPPGGGLIKFAKWEHLMDAVAVFGADRLITVLKSRQIGFSWLLASYAYWTAAYHDGAVVLLFSQGELEAGALLQKCKTIHQYLPKHLKGIVSKANRVNVKLFEFANGSRIMAFPSTEDAGRGETATLAIQDEADFHDNAEANTEALKPTLDAGGQLIQCSTVNKRKAVTLFKANYRAAPENGFTKRFYGWDVRPSRDQAWYDRVRSETSDTAEMSADLYMESAYPRTEAEALRPSRALAAFDPDILESMREDLRTPIETDGIINYYQLPQIGGRYSAGTDTAHGLGTGHDWSVTAIVNVITGMVVADILNRTISPEELAAQSVKMLKRYESPIWTIEDNEWGILTIRMAQTLEYPRLWERGKDQVGWHATNPTRTIMWGDLMEATKTRHITIPNEDGLNQFGDLIRNPNKGGRIEALEGSHDDYPTAVGLAWNSRDRAWDAQKAQVDIITPRSRSNQVDDVRIARRLRRRHR